jgi:DegV family protein with EDD domain
MVAASGLNDMSARVITDSAATLPVDLADRLGVVVVPLRIAFGDRSLRDGDLDADTLVDQALDVSTSGPTPGDYLAAIEQAGDEGAVVLTLSREMGAGSFLAAQAAARAVSTPLRVVDTECAAGAQGLVAIAAADAARSGAAIDGIAEAARSVIERVRLVATLPSLDHLARSGHVPGAAAWAARFVGLYPVIEFRRGRVRPLRPARSAQGARQRLLERVADSKPRGASRLHVCALHARAAGAADDLLVSVDAAHRPATSFVGPFSTAMIVHAGPGVLGLAWWWDPSPA